MPGRDPRAGGVRPAVAAAAAGATVIIALVLMWLGPVSWYGPLGVVGIAALFAWWMVAQAERARARELGEVAAMVRRLAGDPPDDTPGEHTLGRVLARLADLEHRSAREEGERGRAVTRVRAIVDAIAVPVVAADADGVIELANRAAVSVLARKRERLVGRLLEDVLLPPTLLTLVERAREGEPTRGRVRIVDEDRARFFDVSAEPIGSGEAPAGVVVTLRDVTELATAVQLKSDFAANASHELRTPIAAIRGAVETMGAATDDPQMTARLREMIAQHVGRLEEMVADLLDLSRLESQETRVAASGLACSTLAARLDSLFERPCAERRVHLVFDLDPALEHMVIDEHLLELVLRNLIDNAIKFAREGTDVRVVGRASDVEPTADAPTPPASLGGRALTGARFRVIDKGIGIPLAHQQRIFERFYQVDPSRDGKLKRRGTGLGLAIAKHAMRRLGGRIGVESVWQQGTTMNVEIPRCVELDPAGVPPETRE